MRCRLPWIRIGFPQIRRVVLASCTLTLLALTFCSKPGPEPDSVVDVSPGKGELQPIARIGHERIGECSGIVHHDDAFWVHNDSGDEPVLYRSLDLSFESVEILPVPGAEAVDWEEIAIFEGDLLVCDIGDNYKQRDVLTMYRVRYLPASAGSDQGEVELVATYPFGYPDGSHDAEACFTIDGKLHIVNKDRGEGTFVYRFDELRDASDLPAGEVNIPSVAGFLTLETDEMVTAGAYDPKSGTVILLTYSAILSYPKDRLDGSPELVTRTWARQCEAICLCGDKLVFTNEERDVFVVNDFVGKKYSELLPPRGSTTLPAKSLDVVVDGTGSSWASHAATIPLHESRPNESIAWLLNDEEILMRGRLEFDKEFRETDADSARLGSALLIMFAPEPNPLISEGDRLLAIGMEPEGGLSVWRLRFVGFGIEMSPFPHSLWGSVYEGVFQFEVALPVSEIFGASVPDRFHFDIRGFRLHEETEAYFSGPGLWSFQRPYVWGDVLVQR
jgi:hypothetical protein